MATASKKLRVFVRDDSNGNFWIACPERTIGILAGERRAGLIEMRELLGADVEIEIHKIPAPQGKGNGH